MRVHEVCTIENTRQVPAKMRIQAPGEQWKRGGEQLAGGLNVVGNRQQRRQFKINIEQRQRPYLPFILQSVPGSVRPEELVQVAQFIEMKRRIASQERLDLNLVVKERDVHLVSSTTPSTCPLASGTPRRARGNIFRSVDLMTLTCSPFAPSEINRKWARSSVMVAEKTLSLPTSSVVTTPAVARPFCGY